MAETNANAATVTPPPPRNRRVWLRALGWFFGVLIVLLFAVYFVATSSAFFKGVILPRVAKAINAKVTVSDAAISPFKQVILRDLKVQTTGTEPLLTASEVVARYHLMDILGGRINVDELIFSSPTVVLVENPDHTSNLDPILKSQTSAGGGKKPETTPAAKSSKAMQIDLKKLALNEADVRQVKLYAGGNRDLAELSRLSVTVENLRNGETGKLTLSTEIKLEDNPPAPATNGLLLAKANGSFDLALSPDLKPAAVKGNIHLDVSRADGALIDLASLAGDLNCDVTPAEIKQVVLHFQKGATRLGEVRASGPFDLAKKEGRFNVEIRSVDKALLNLVGAKHGIDFGSTLVNSTNQVELAKAGSVVNTVGDLDLARFQVTRAHQTTPALDLRAQYNLSLDLSQSNALIHALTLSATQKSGPLLRAELTSPMNLSWGDVANGLGDSTLNLTLTRLDLADWKPFLGSLAPAGTINAQMKLLSQQSGKQLTFDLNSQAENLTLLLQTNEITHAAVTLQANGQASKFKRFSLTGYKLQLARNNQALAACSGAGTYDTATSAADLQVTVQATLARLLDLFPQPDTAISSGTLDLKGHVTQTQGGNRRIAGSVALADFTGHVGKNALQAFGTTMDLDLGMTPAQVQIQKAVGKVTQNGKPGGSFEMGGTYNLSSKAAQLTAKLTDFNANGLRSFVEPLLADKKLVSVALNATSTVRYDPKGSSSVKGDLQVTNLVVNDPKNQFPSTALAARVQVDASQANNVADIRQLQLGLTPTARAANEIKLTGQLDRSRTNVTQGHLKLAADALDLTSYYDLFTGQKRPGETTAQPKTASSSPSSGPAKPETEPAPVKLPFQNFVADMNVGRLYLRELQLTNFQATLRLDGGHIVLKPFQGAINGAPVAATADLDLGVLGYKYDTSFDAKAVPLPPLIDSFQPARKGQIGGTFTAHTKIAGLGITGASLQKNLNGQFDFTSTNLNLSVVNIKSPMIRTIINVVAGIPELMRDPLGTVGGLFQGLVSKNAPKGGLADELQRSPVDSIVAHGAIGAGRVNLQQALVQSTAFRAEAAGAITLAEVLTNSTINVPVTLYLSRSIAQRVNLVPANTPTNAAYAKLPDFLTLEGTVGSPKPDTKKLAVAGTALKAIGGVIPGNSTAGNLIQGIGGLLTGNTGATNAPGTNQPGGLLGGLLGGPTGQTNRSSTNQPATNQSPVDNLLNDILSPRKK
jgi:hypothetical protein